MTVDDVPELVPVDGAEVPMARFAARRIPLEMRIGQRDPQYLCLRDGRIDELLSQVVVPDALDPPSDGILAVSRLAVMRPEHHQRRPPPAVDGVLHHRALLVSALHHR